MAGNILISFDNENNMKVDFKGDKKSMFGFNDVDLLRAIMAMESMMVTQSKLDVSEIRELLDDEREHSKVRPVEKK